jgi:hypothetical protein
MSFTNYLEHATLDLFFGGTSFTPSGNLWVGVSTTTPTEAGANFTEPNATGGYARVQVANNKTTWSNAAQSSTSGVVTNNIAITFPEASGWGTITHAGIFDGSGVGANLLIQSALNTSKVVGPNDILRFSSGNIVIRID